MADEDHTDKTAAELEARVWELAKRIDFCMLITAAGGPPHARPMSSRVHRDVDTIYFLVDAAGDKNAEIDSHPTVVLAYTDSGANKYLTITGEATISNDRGRIKGLWSEFDKAWWDGPEDPAIRLLAVRPHSAELWDSPGKLAAAALMFNAALTGEKPKFGDHGTVEM